MLVMKLINALITCNKLINLHLFKKPDSFLFFPSIDVVGWDVDEFIDKSEERSVSSVLSL